MIKNLCNLSNEKTQLFPELGVLRKRWRVGDELQNVLTFQNVLKFLLSVISCVHIYKITSTHEGIIIKG